MGNVPNGGEHGVGGGGFIKTSASYSTLNLKKLAHANNLNANNLYSNTKMNASCDQISKMKRSKKSSSTSSLSNIAANSQQQSIVQQKLQHINQMRAGSHENSNSKEICKIGASNMMGSNNHRSPSPVSSFADNGSINVQNLKYFLFGTK
jgi:hypothetical protein